MAQAEIERLRAVNAELVSVLREIVEFCDDPDGSEKPETLAMGLARMLPSARAVINRATNP